MLPLYFADINIPFNLSWAEPPNAAASAMFRAPGTVGNECHPDINGTEVIIAYR